MEGDMKRIIVIIPSLNPDEKILQVIEDLKSEGFENIILVDDGSKEKSKDYFCRGRKEFACHVLVHDINKGKGAAIKTAIKYILTNTDMKNMNIAGVVTVDGDNQHKAVDVKRVCLRMLAMKDTVVLGSRDFSDQHIPFRSRFGNKLTSQIFGFLCGMKLSDTQTGLRAIPYIYLERMLCVEGERYEYETNMLLAIKKEKIPYFEEKIQTIYIEDNQSSHFNPLLDSVKIYKYIFKFCISSFSASIVDIGIFSLLIFLLPLTNVNQNLNVMFATVGARVISSLFNYFVNKNLVFQAKSGNNTLVKYYSLCVTQMLASYCLVTLFSTVFFTIPTGGIVVIKIIVDSCLFLASYRIQHSWIFN